MIRLPLQQEAFVLEHCLDFDSGRAALAAGSKTKHIGARVLTFPRVQQAIEEEMDLRRERLRVDADKVTEELARIAFADMRNYVPADSAALDLRRLNQDQTRAIQKLSIDEEERAPTRAQLDEGQTTPTIRLPAPHQTDYYLGGTLLH